jgi:hypothetical protein
MPAGRSSALPEIEGEIDEAYLAAALTRAGRSSHPGALTLAVLADGRQSSPVLSLTPPNGAGYVLKIFARENWRNPLLGDGNIEARLFANGVTRAMPAPLSVPSIDLALHKGRDEIWLLMDDVSAGILPRGAFDEEKARWLLSAFAALHARYWEKAEELAALPLLSLEANIAVILEPILAFGGRRPAEGWRGAGLEKITVLKPMLPILFDVLGPADTEYFLDLGDHREGWVRVFAEAPHTFCHGDIRRANLALFSPDRIVAFDWDMASNAPAALDLAWYWFLQFWAYPANDGRHIADREPLLAYYMGRLADTLGRRFDRRTFERAFDLAWLKVFLQLGFCLIDPISGKHSAEDRARVGALVGRAMDEAKRIHDKHVR